ncbi:desmethyl-deoxy-podophyllotoxin synthase-like isoform X1 [Typha angustifolia]|uniref:desmethyl-deoxy-podophyllotoxin synthase-like isoform X1 n=2 Tax=Typha angustifolia TaxID=59011 RepID=UPI003C30C9DE
MELEISYCYSTFFAVVIVFVLAYLKISTYSNKSATRPPPGPWKLPIIGSIHHLVGSLPHRAMRDLAIRHGADVMLLKLGEVPTVVLSSREAAKEVMKTHDIAFASRPMSVTIEVLTSGGKDIVFAPYGDYWRQLRKICVLELLSSKRVQSFRCVREEEVTNLVRSIWSSSPSSLVNLSERLYMLVNDMTARAVFGSKCKEQNAFLRALDESINLSAGFNLADLFPSSRIANMLSGVTAKAQRCTRTVHQIVDRIIQEHKVRQNRATVAGTEEDLLDVLLKIQEEGGLQFPLTTEAIRAVIFDIFGAGSETSATTLVWAMSELVRNPGVMKKVQSEVRRVYQERPRLVTEENINELRYLQLVIKETLRLHVPVPLLLPRQCSDTCRLSGYDIPEGATVIVNAWAIGRDPRYWTDPDEFVPERFEDGSVDFKGTDFEFIPFGAGRRICPGMSFGLANVELTLASLLYHFDWEIPNGMKPDELDMDEAFGLTARRKTDLSLRAVPRIPCLTT